MKDGQPENKFMQMGNLIASVCSERNMSLPMATEFKLGGTFRMHPGKVDMRHVTAAGKVILREIQECLEQKDIELAKKMLAKEIECVV